MGDTRMLFYSELQRLENAQIELDVSRKITKHWLL